MFKNLKFALILLLFCFIQFTPVMADPFSDIPGDHWSYDAVQMLEEKGLVEGYPDGLFKGDRPTTRYEMAMVVARVIAKLEQVQASIPEIPDLSIYATKQDLETINRLIDEFRNELDALGVRVTSIEDSLGKLTGRVEELERIKISGTFESVALSSGIWPEEGNISGPGTIDSETGFVRAGFDRYMNPIGSAFVITDGYALINRLDLTVTAKIADKIKGGGNLIAYSAFGERHLIECWGAMVPYNTTGVYEIWNQNFQADMGTLWIDSDDENWDFTVKAGEYNLNKVSKNLLYAQRSIIACGGRDVFPLEGLNISGKLYKTVDVELFMAYNSNVFRGVNDHSIYTLGNPFNDGAGSVRVLTNGAIAPGLFDNAMYGAWMGYDYEKTFHIEGAYLRIFDDFASNPVAAPSQEPRDTKYYGFKGHYNLNEKIKIYGEFGGTIFDFNLRDSANDTGTGYLFNVGAQATLDKIDFYGEFDYTGPSYDPFSYHQTWERSYTDGNHKDWNWKFGGWGNSVRFGKFRPNRLGFDGGITYKLGSGAIYGDFTYLQQVEPTRNTLDDKTFNMNPDPAIGTLRPNIYGNQDSVFRYASDDKGSELFLEVGGKYSFGENLHVWGMYDYNSFQRDYAAGTTGRVTDNSTDFAYHFINTGVTYDVTKNFSVQGNLEYFKWSGVMDNGADVDQSQLIPGCGVQYRFNDSTWWMLDYKFYSFNDDILLVDDSNNDYNANRLMTRLMVKF